MNRTKFLKFIDYVYDFYNPNNGIYPMNITYEDIVTATRIHLKTPDLDFAADSIDREQVREIMTNKMKKEFLLED